MHAPNAISSKGPGRFHFLDALRGLAALAVMLYHFHSPIASPIHEELASSMPAALDLIISHMYCGVEVFFVLSGFVIAFSMAGNRHDIGYAGNFIVRRSLRLDPPYWTAAALMLSYFAIRWPHLRHDYYVMFGGMKGIAANLFYVQDLSFIYPAKSILDVSWTLNLEVQFYLSYLLLLVGGHYMGALAGRRGRSLSRGVVVLAVMAIGVWSLMYFIQHPGVSYAQRSWMFFLGVGLYGALSHGVPVSAVLVPVIALGGWFGSRGQLDPVVTLATAAAIYTVGGMGRFTSFLAHRPLLHLGKISYSLYLVHTVVGLNLLSILSAWAKGSQSAAWFAWALAIMSSLIAAELLHRLVEAPANRLSQRFKRQPLNESRISSGAVQAAHGAGVIAKSG